MFLGMRLIVLDVLGKEIESKGPFLLCHLAQLAGAPLTFQAGENRSRCSVRREGDHNLRRAALGWQEEKPKLSSFLRGQGAGRENIALKYKAEFAYLGALC